MKVLVINNNEGDITVEREILQRAFPDLEIKYIPTKDRKTILKEAADADAVIPVLVDFDRKTLETMKKCKIIATQSIGVDSIDLKAATELGIYVTNNPDYCIEEVAAQAVTLLLACNRNIVRHDRLTRKGIWKRNLTCGDRKLHRISESTVGVVSLGHIGRRVAQIMQAMGADVIGFDPFLPQEIFDRLKIKKTDTLEELFSSSDMVTLHTPLMPDTKGMVDKRLLDCMKEGSILVNTSRGGIINETDLYYALKAGRPAAAGIDVIEDEQTYKSRLYELGNVIITPHVAFYTEEALTESRRKSAEMVVDLIAEHKVPKYLVNKDILK